MNQYTDGEARTGLPAGIGVSEYQAVIDELQDQGYRNSGWNRVRC